MSKRKAFAVIVEKYDYYTTQIFIDALFGSIADAYLMDRWQAEQFKEYAKLFGINRDVIAIGDGIYGIVMVK